MAGYLVLIVYLILFPPPALGQEAPPAPPPPLGNCYAMNVLEILEGSPALGFLDQEADWWIFICPAGEQPVLDGGGPLKELLRGLSEDGPLVTRWMAGRYAAASERWLEQQVCGAVAIIRAVSPEDPDDDRDRGQLEIARWTCEVIAGVPWDGEERRCDWEADPLAPRPADVRREIRSWDLPPHVLKTLHDTIKPLASGLCPRTP